jgi:tetraacyldisaccharide 4'-kinase
VSLADLHRRLARGEERGAGDRIAGALLAPLALLYRGAVAMRNAAYDHALAPVARADCPVLCVGSLSAGGTGKPPCAAAIALRLARAGARPLLVAHGYGALRPTALPLLLTDGTGAPRFDWSAVGEEAILLARLAPGVPIAVARRREEALGPARAAGCPVDLLVLDGGFQHRRLRADLTLVTLDASRAPGSGHLLPWGDLREPWSALHRADAILLHRSDLAPDPAAWERALRRRAPGVPVIGARNAPVAPRTLLGAPVEWSGLRTERLAVWTAIAQPAPFLAGLALDGVRPALVVSARDHAPFDEKAAGALRAACRRERCQAVLVTEKDAVKLEGRAADLPPVIVIGARFEIVTGAEALDRLLRERLGATL